MKNSAKNAVLNLIIELKKLTGWENTQILQRLKELKIDTPSRSSVYNWLKTQTKQDEEIQKITKPRADEIETTINVKLIKLPTESEELTLIFCCDQKYAYMAFRKKKIENKLTPEVVAKFVMDYQEHLKLPVRSVYLTQQMFETMPTYWNVKSSDFDKEEKGFNDGIHREQIQFEQATTPVQEIAQEIADITQKLNQKVLIQKLETYINQHNAKQMTEIKKARQHFSEMKIRENIIYQIACGKIIRAINDDIKIRK